MLEEIMKDRVIDTKTAAVRFCIVETYNKYFKTYGKDKLVVEATRVREPAKTKAEKTEEQMMKLCTDMGGILEVKDGKKMCHYTIYEVLNPNYVEQYPSTIPLNMITPEIIARQYFPNKKEVQKVLTNTKK